MQESHLLVECSQLIDLSLEHLFNDKFAFTGSAYSTLSSHPAATIIELSLTA